MDKNLFLKNMEEMIQIAKTNGNQIDHKELLDYFSDYELNEEAKKLLIASFVEAGIRVLGVDDSMKNNLNRWIFREKKSKKN